MNAWKRLAILLCLTLGTPRIVSLQDMALARTPANDPEPVSYPATEYSDALAELMGWNESPDTPAAASEVLPSVEEMLRQIEAAQHLNVKMAPASASTGQEADVDVPSGSQVDPNLGVPEPTRGLTRSERPPRQPEGGVCPDNCANRIGRAPPTSLSHYGRQFLSTTAPQCTMFIKADGSYGELGELIASTLLKSTRLGYLLSDEVAQNRTMKRACPRFQSMSREERAYVWVWSHGAIGFMESSCGNIRVNPSNSEAIGMFQLNKSLSGRDWRGPHCEVSSVRADRENTLCALDIMRGQFTGFYGSPPGLYPNAYYEKLRGSYAGDFNRAILKRIAANPACKE